MTDKLTTETTNVTQAVRESYEQLAGIIASAMNAIITVNAAQQIVMFNQAAEKMFGVAEQEALQQSLDRFIPARFHTAHHRHIDNFGETKVSNRKMGVLGAVYGIRANGEEFPVEASISHTEVGGRKFFTVIMRDLTEQKKLEAQLLRAQRMESIGTLAGGIAHDLNNILSPVLMATQTLQLKITDPDALKWLQIMQENVQRGADLVKQVLFFARGIDGERVLLQVKHLIKEIVKILNETLPKSVAIKYSIEEELWPVIGDATQIHQVLMNLCVNARDAMPKGGTLTLNAENKIVDEGYARLNLDARPGRFVHLTITDSGEGIAAEHLDRIFEPFFTTKEKGKGTGLGLSTSLSIIKSHQGFINVYSEPGQGTQFNIFLPAAEETETISTETPSATLPMGNGELILVADDEANIREITQGVLESFGYRVITAGDGTAALALYAAHQSEIAVVLTDMMMPFMDGPATIRALQHMNPQVKIIACSGIAADKKLADAMQAGVKYFLTKPISLEKLLKTVAEVIKTRGR